MTDDELISGAGESGEAESGSDLPIPFPETSDPVLPPAETSTAVVDIGKIVVITPDGPVIMYEDASAADIDALTSLADERWLERNGATTKDFSRYSVTEALLFIVAACSLFFLFKNIFKGRKL